MKKAITEIRGQDSAELKAKLSELRKEQFRLRFHGSAEEVAKTTRHREVRRTIARILMVLDDRARAGAVEAAVAAPAGTAPAATVAAKKVPAGKAASVKAPVGKK